MSKHKNLIPLSIPNIDDNEYKYLKECLDSGWVSSAGQFVDRFEKAVAGYTGAKYAVSCINGTAGLFIALKLSGIKYNDEVIVPTVSFIAPINTVRYTGGQPVFMDCDDYLNLDVDKFSRFCEKECVLTKNGLKNKRSARIIKAVMPVHVFGNPCNMEAIMKIAKKFRLKVIEDATESLGAYYTKGAYRNRFTGTIGDFGVYSFNGNKIITAAGGGMIVTGNKNLAERAKYLTNQAKDDPINAVHNEVGYNFRLSSLQAALGISQLEKLNSFIKIKKINYGLYKEELKGMEGLEVLGIPDGTIPNYWFYSLIIEKEKYGCDRKKLMLELASKGIETRPLWYLCHMQRPYLKNQAYSITRAFWFWNRVLNIPCSTNLTENQVRKVALTIGELKETIWKS